MLSILVIEDEPELRDSLQDHLEDAGHRVETANDGGAGARRLEAGVVDLVICDVRLPEIDGLTLLRRIRKDSPTTNVILMTGYSEVSQAVAALKEGAYDYLTKPFDVDELLLQVQRIDEVRRLQSELENIRGELSGSGAQTKLVGESPKLRHIHEMIGMVSQSDAPTLVTGESGTGKEVVARMVHDRSARRLKPFVVVNCGALAENLVEAELFGHERGAFTGAVRKRDGRFKAADGGTLFLDEIAELPLAAQAKLLRVLQEGVLEPLGTNTSVHVDVRVVSATHRNLVERIKTGAFREDLYYRINVIQIPLPPLRERPGDLPLLIGHFLARHTRPGRPVPGISPAAWAALARYPFPGNVRELSHAVEHAMVLSGGGDIGVVHLPPSIVGTETPARDNVIDGDTPIVRPLHDALREFEHGYIQRALSASAGKRTQTAALLGISRKSLWEKLRQNGSDYDREEGPLP